MSGPAGHPLIGRQRHLVFALRVALVLAALASVSAVVLDGEAGEFAGAGFVAILVATPLLRVVWLVVRWVRRGDRRFALVGAGVLAVALVAIGTAIL